MRPAIARTRQVGWQRLAQRFAFRFLSNVVALFVASLVFGGIDHGGFWTLVLAGLVFSVVNAVVRPLVIVLALPAVILTLGLALLLVNALMLWLTGQIVGSFEVSGFWTAVGGAVIVWLANTALEAILRPEARLSPPPRRGGA